MALFYSLKSSLLSAMQDLYELFVCADPPRLYILLLLLFILLIIFLKAGIFGEHTTEDPQTPYSRGNFCEPAAAHSQIPYADGPRCFYSVAIPDRAILKEELQPPVTNFEQSKVMVPYQKRTSKDTGKHVHVEEPFISDVIVNEEADDDELGVEELHRRVEAFIHKVRMGFFAER